MCAKALSEFDGLLINRVQWFPCLYNINLRDFRNQPARQMAWRKIAEELGSEDSHCQRRWRLIRDTYVRYKKAQENVTNLPFVKKEENPLMESLNFLDSFVKHRAGKFERRLSGDLNSPAEYDEGFVQDHPTTAYLEGESDIDNESSASNGTPFSTFIDNSMPAVCRQDYFRTPKRRRDDAATVPDRVLLSALMSGETARVDDELDCFVKSVSGTLHRFTARQRAVAKVRIQQLLLDVEFGDENSVSLLEPQVPT